MYVNVAVLRETRTEERRVALVPELTSELVKLGAKLHMETGGRATPAAFPIAHIQTLSSWTTAPNWLLPRMLSWRYSRPAWSWLMRCRPDRF